MFHSWGEIAIARDCAAPMPQDLHAELLKLGELREKGILSEEEFQACKTKLLEALQ